MTYLAVAVGSALLIALGWAAGLRVGWQAPVRYLTRSATPEVLVEGDWVELGAAWPVDPGRPGGDGSGVRRLAKVVKTEVGADGEKRHTLSDSSVVPIAALSVSTRAAMEVQRVAEMDPHDRWLLAVWAG